jgi:hypothetical protein
MLWHLHLHTTSMIQIWPLVYASAVLGEASVRLLRAQDRYFSQLQYSAAKAPSLQLAGACKILLPGETDDD